MRRIKFFIFVEAILLSLAFLTILASDFLRATLIFIFFLIILYYYLGRQKENFLLSSLFLLFLFLMVFNPFIVAAVLFAVVYGLLLFLPEIQKEKEETHLNFDDDVAFHRDTIKWIGHLHHFTDENCQFDDINLIRFSGADTIHLEEVILANHDNVILLRKVFGNTKIIVPVDVAVNLKVTSFYGEVSFLAEGKYFLRNSSVSFITKDFKRATKSVKIVVSNFAGDVEVV